MCDNLSFDSDIQSKLAELEKIKNGPRVNKASKRFAVSRIISKGWDNIHPEITEALKNDERYIEERNILRSNGML